MQEWNSFFYETLKLRGRELQLSVGREINASEIMEIRDTFQMLVNPRPSVLLKTKRSNFKFTPKLNT